MAVDKGLQKLRRRAISAEVQVSRGDGVKEELPAATTIWL
jgi:hypothetical protein